MVDVVVIGAGPSGCVAASYLYDRGYTVKVVEKSKFPRFVIGESLLPRCMDHFEESGLLDCLKKEQFEVKPGVRIVRKDKVCEFDFSHKHTEGWEWTWQVPRSDFDNALANELMRKGIEISFETEVLDVVFKQDHAAVETRDKNGIHTITKGRYIIDASGFGRVLPKLMDLETPGHISGNGSIFTHITEQNQPEGQIGRAPTFEIVNEKTWFWVIPFSNGNSSIGFVGPSEFIKSFEGDTSAVMTQMLSLLKNQSERFRNTQFLFNPVSVNFFSKSVKKNYGRRFAITGSSAEFIDPVFSSGVTFATESGLLAAKLIIKELEGTTVDWETEYAQYLKSGVDVFASFVKEWYTGNLQKLFFDEQAEDRTKRQISSVLAGYVWDKTNPFVTKHKNIISSIAYFIDKKQENRKAAVLV